MRQKSVSKRKLILQVPMVRIHFPPAKSRANSGTSLNSTPPNASDLPGTQFLRLRREAEKGIDLPFREQIHRLDRGVGADDPADAVDRVEPDMASHRGEERMRARPHALYADGPAPQIGNAANALPAE
jgi:hypothetical protein